MHKFKLNCLSLAHADHDSNGNNPTDSPPAAFFDRVRTNSYNQSLSLENSNTTDTLSVDFDTLFGIWSAISAGNERFEIEQILNNSHLFTDGTVGNHSDNEERAKKFARSNTTTPRRSRRILENPPNLTYSPKKTRQQKGMTKTDGAAPANLELVTAITRALEQEVINALPLDSGVASDVNKYCGTHLTTNLIHRQGLASREEIRQTMAMEYNMDEELILKSLEYDPY